MYDPVYDQQYDEIEAEAKEPPRQAGTTQLVLNNIEDALCTLVILRVP